MPFAKAAPWSSRADTVSQTSVPGYDPMGFMLLFQPPALKPERQFSDWAWVKDKRMAVLRVVCNIFISIRMLSFILRIKG